MCMTDEIEAPAQAALAPRRYPTAAERERKARERVPRQIVDFSAVPPSQFKIHDRLENWARWCRDRPNREGSAGSPMFALYRSSEARRAYGFETNVPVDKFDAAAIAKAVAVLPDKHRRALQWCYLHPRNPIAMARELGVSLSGMADLVTAGRQMLINKRA